MQVNANGQFPRSISTDVAGNQESEDESRPVAKKGVEYLYHGFSGFGGEGVSENDRIWGIYT